MATHPKVRFNDEMETILIEQDRFMQNQTDASAKLEKPKESVFKQRQRAKRQNDGEQMRQGTVDFERIVGNVVEREATTQLAPIEPKASVGGFPQAVHRSVKQFKRAIVTMNPAKPTTQDAATEMDAENLAILASMSQAEIEQEAQEIVKNLDASLLEFIKKRVQSKYPSTMEPDRATCPPAEPDTETKAEVAEEQPRQVLESSKLAWTSPIEPELPVGEKDVGLSTRFNLQGTPLSKEEIENLPTHLALHHHGDHPGAAGYTLVELLMLSRSTVAAQRSMALSCLSGVIQWSSKNSTDHLDWLMRNGLLEWCLHALSETAMTEAAVALDVLSAIIDAFSDVIPPNPHSSLSDNAEDGWMDWIALNAPDVPEEAIFASGKACGWQWTAQQTKVYAMDRVEAPALEQDSTSGFGLWPRRAQPPVPYEHKPLFEPRIGTLSKLRVEPCRSLLLHGLKSLLSSNVGGEALMVAKKLARSFPTIIVELLPVFRTMLTSRGDARLILRLVRYLAVYADAEVMVSSGIIEAATRFLASDVLDQHIHMEAMLLIATTLDGTNLTDVDVLLSHFRTLAPSLLRLNDGRRAGVFRVLQSIVFALCSAETTNPDVAISMRVFVEWAIRLIDSPDETVLINAAYFLAIYFEKLEDPFGTLLDSVKGAARRLVVRVGELQSDGAKAAAIRLAGILIPDEASAAAKQLVSNLPDLADCWKEASMTNELELAKSKTKRWLHVEVLSALPQAPVEQTIAIISQLTFGEEPWLHRLVRKPLFSNMDSQLSTDLAPLVVRTLPKLGQERRWRACPLPACWPLIPLVELSKADVVAEKDVVKGALELAKVCKQVVKDRADEQNLALARMFLIDVDESDGQNDEPAYRDSDLLATWMQLHGNTLAYDHATYSDLLHAYLTTSFGDVNYTHLMAQLLQTDELEWWMEFWGELNTAFAGRWLAIVSACKMFPADIPIDKVIDEGLTDLILAAVNNIDQEDVDSASQDGKPMLLDIAQRYLTAQSQ